MFFNRKRRRGKEEKEVKVTELRPTREIINTGNITIDGNKRNSNGILSYRVANLQMIGARENQEDSFAVINALDVTKILTDGLFAVICDGMGGMKDGKLISEAAVQGFVTSFYNLDLQEKENIPSQLSDACHSVNNTIRESFGDSGGTTVALVLVFNSELYWLAVGDSPIFLKRGGNLIKLNKEHIYLNELYLRELQRETIYKASAETANQKESLTEYIGKSEIEEIDLSRTPLPLGIGDVIFLCSDGVSSYIDESEISKAVDLPPKETCAYLDAAIKSKNHSTQDNYTCVIISCV